MNHAHPSSRTPTIGKAELEILSFIHEHHPATVRQVANHFAQSRGLVRTTALNVMTRLCKKGFLTRKKTDGIFFYSPKIPQQKLLRSLVGDFIQQIADLRKMVQELHERKEKP